MSVISLNTEYTMLEVAKSLGAQGDELALIDTLSQQNPFLEEGYWMEADDFQTHHFNQVLNEPTGSDSVVNVGVAWDVANTTPVTELIQGIVDWLRIDNRILSKHPNPRAYIEQQIGIFTRGLAKTFHDRIIYGNYVANTSVGVGSVAAGGVSADRVNGLAARFNTIATNPWYNVVSNTGAASNGESSTWIIQWGPDGMFFVYPRGGKNWVSVEDKGVMTVYDSNYYPYDAYVIRFEIEFGLCVADPRKVQRLANIDNAASTSKWLADNQLISLGQLPNGSDGAVMYVPRFVKTQMQIAANDKSNVLYGSEEIWGHNQMMFQDVPVRMCERIAANEAVVS